MKKPNYKKIMLCAGAVALAMICAIQENNDSTMASDSIILMNAGNEVENETAVFGKEDREQGLVIEEKVAVDPDYIFDKVNEQMYITRIVDCKVEPKDLSDTMYVAEKGTEVSVLGRNHNGYLKILLCGQETYVKEDALTTDKDSVFFDCSYTMYAPGEMELYEDTVSKNVISELVQYDELHVIGENDSGYLYVIHGDLKGYVKRDGLLEYIPGELHVEAFNAPTTTYYEENMYDGVLADVPDTEKTEENIELLAKLIHCEAGGQIEDGKLAVGTVVINRCYDGYWGSTIKEVIEAKSQFSPVASGRFYVAEYTEEDYECARKVLIDGYRSFPAYVMYFQSIGEGYFNQQTYCICRDASGNWPQYFSYKQSDLEKYKN